MGMFKQKSQPTFTPTPAPEPKPDAPSGFDPEALKQARTRADRADARMGRRKLRIPLSTSTGGNTSGVQIS